MLNERSDGIYSSRSGFNKVILMRFQAEREGPIILYSPDTRSSVPILVNGIPSSTNIVAKFLDDELILNSSE